MKAAVLRRFDDEMVIEDRPEPTPGEDQTLVRVHAVGLCGTDLKIASGALPGIKVPLVLGHEVAGEVVKTGNGAFQPGQRVACYFYGSCGTCLWCKAGQPTLCPAVSRLGFERDGGLCELLCVDDAHLLAIADRVEYVGAAVAMDALTTPWHAIHAKMVLQPSETVAIVGAGGLGLHAVQIAVRAGADVVVVEPRAGARAMATELGAAQALSPTDHQRLAQARRDGVDAVLELSGTVSGFGVAAQLVRPGGRIVCCGYQPSLTFGIDSSRLVLDEVAVLGSRAGSKDDAEQVLAAVQADEIHPIIASRHPLSEVNEAMTRLREGPTGRVVVTVAAAS
ncbi:MAG: zinc-binding dehydrogenase [Solirubrobacteraceae bacterium]|nr:zinc-binding dehydrogenase [Solirubrobacteraceae bacterium]